MSKGSTLAPFVFARGEWYCQQANPPDRKIPASVKPPGVTGQGCWIAGELANPNSSKGLRLRGWIWCPLPLNQVQVIPNGSGGQVAVMAAGQLIQVARPPGFLSSSWASRGFESGPWNLLLGQSASTNGGGSGYGGNAGPAANPSGASGTWVARWQAVGPKDLAHYLNMGQYFYFDDGSGAAATNAGTSSSSLLAYVAGGALIVGGGIYALA